MKNALELIHSKNVNLKKAPTRIKSFYKSDEDFEKILKSHLAQLDHFQNLLYSNQTHGMLIIFQGMDTAGKDGAIKHVLSGVNPQGCRVASFKVPSSLDLTHDFMWRVNLELPQRGQIGVFNRSYYEDLLVPKVHPETLLNEKYPKEVLGKGFWKNRYNDIRHYENYLLHQGFRIVKIFLHISKEEQKLRLLERFNDHSKHWKISEGDVHERLFFKNYQNAYQECFNQTSTKEAPWWLVPADDKKNARLMISRILIDCLKDLRLKPPRLTAKQEKTVARLKKILT